MIACVDLDGTVSVDPDFYRGELRGLMDKGWQVHVLTGNPTAHHELAQLGMVKGRDFSHIAIVPRKHIAKFKVAYMRQVGATHLIDNRRKNAKAAVKAGFTAHHHMAPEKKD